MFGFPKFPSAGFDPREPDIGGGSGLIDDDLGPGGNPGGGPPGGGSTPGDSTGPSLSVSTVSPSSLSLAYLGSSSVTVTVSASDIGSGVNTVTLDGSSMSLVTSGVYRLTKSFSYNSSYAGTTRTHTFLISASDNAGNLSATTRNMSITYAPIPDTTQPSISITNVSSSSISLNNSTTSRSTTFTVVASDAGGLSSVSMNNGATLSSVSGSTYYFTRTFSFNDYSFGTTNVTFTATAIDNAGNSRSDSSTVSVTKSDTQAPSISSFSKSGSSTINVSSSNQTITYTVTATDNRSVNSVSVTHGSFSHQSLPNFYFTESFATSAYSFGTTSVTRTAYVTDAAGNTATKSITFNVVKNDVTKPSISAFSVNDSTVTLTTGSQSQTVTYHAKVSDNVGISSHSLSGASFSSSSGSNYYWTETFSYGDYSFGSTSVSRTVSFSDAAGNSRSSTLSLTVTKSDTQAPSISSFSANNSSVALNNSTTSVSRTFTVNVSDNVGVSNVTVDGLTYSSRSGNNWYFTKTFSFNDYSFGSQTITFVAVATDSAGNTATKNTSISLTKSDTQAPSISSFTVSDSSISLTTSSQSQTVSFAVTATDNRGISSVSVSGATYTGASGNTYNFTKTYSYGSYNFGTTNISETATVTDSAGNSSTSSKSMTVSKTDNQAPSISAFTVNDSTVSLTTSSQSQTVTFTVTTTDNRGVNSVSVNNGASFSSSSGNKYYFTKTFSYGSYGFGNTTNTFTATSTDAAGNSTTASLNVTITKSDNQSPVIQSFSVNDSTVNVTTSSTSQTVTYSVKTTDNRGISSVSIPGASHTGTSGSTYTFTETFNYNSYSFGTTNLTRTVTVADAAGNAATKSLSLSVTKTDNQSPIISNYSAANTSLAVTSTSTSVTATFTATITDNVAIDYVRFEGNPPTGSSGNTYTYVRTYNYSSLSFGSNSFTIPCYAQDTAGNSATVNETITVSKTDNTAPTISNLSVSRNPSVTTDNQTDTITITADVTDNTAVGTVTIPGATFVGKSGNTYTFTKTYDYDDYSFGDTLDTITVTATDNGGNPSGDDVQTTLSKTDTQAPTITSFSVDSSTVNLTTSSQTKVAVFTVVASDNVGVNSISVSGASQYSASGNTYVFHKTYRYSNYSFGTTTDTCTLTVQDAAGNTSTDSINMSIVKTDNQAPSINSFSVNDSSVVLLSSSKTQTITFSANVTDNVGVSNLSLSGGVTASDTSGPDYTWTKTFNYDDYSYGSINQTFTLTATDAAGNSSNSSLTVSIQKTDNQDPSISSIGRKSSSNANITSVTLLASSQNTEVVTFTVNVTDNRAVSNVTLTGATLSSNTATKYIFTKAYAFGSYSFGSTTDSLTATATDAAGNTDTFNTSITVIKRDNVGPSISGLSASSSSVSLTSAAQNTETITFTASISDNVGISSVSFGGLTPSVSGNNYTWTKNYAFGSYSFGSSTDTLTLSVTDTAGNTATDSVSVSITKTDNVAPTITSYSASATQLTWLASDNNSSAKNVTFTVVTSDDVGVSSIGISGATQTNVSGNTYTFTRAYSRPVLGNAATSSAAILTVTDAAGNSSSDSITISTVYTDNVNPTISSFSANDTTVSLTTTSQSQTVTFTGVATDNHGVTAVYFDNNSPDSSSGNTHTWSKTYNYGSYSFGNHSDTITFAATDAAGNTSSQDLVVSINKSDNQAPNISTFNSSTGSIELTTQNPSTSVTFTVVASDNVSVTGLSVSGATLVSNSGNTYGFVKSYAFDDFNFGTVNDTVTATATDGAGNSSTSSVTISVTKSDDTNPTISSFSVNDSSVVVSTDSQFQTVTFSVTATDNFGISSVSVPGTTFVSNSNGTRTFQKTYAYNDLNFGTVNESFTATVTDTLGNTTSESLTISVTKNDSQDPSISSFTVSDSSITLTTDSQSQTVTFAVVATDNRAVTSKSVTGATFVNKSGNTFNFSKTYNYNDYSFGNSTRTETATIGDAAGNTTTETLTVNISKTDNQNPTISSFTSSVSSINLKTSSQSASVTFTCVATDNVSVSNVEIGGLNATNTSGNNYTLTKTYNYDDFSFGSNSVNVPTTVTDSAGNESQASTTITIIKIDDQNPTISSFGVSDETIVLTTASQTQTVSYSAVISDNRAVTGVTIDGQSITGSGNNYSLSKTYDYDDYNFGANTDTVTVIATDAAGNTSSSSKTVSISKSDTQNPTISSFSANDNTVSLLTSSQTQTVTFTAVVTDNVGVSSVAVSGATQTNVSGNTYTFTKQYSYNSYSFGSSTDTVTATATDAAGNSSTSSITISITKSDDQNPTISSFSVNDSSMSLSTSSQTQTAIFTAVVSDNVGINSISVSGATQVNVSGSTYTFHKTYNYNDYSFGSSTDVVTLTVSDAAGNSSTDSETITIVKADDEDPVINSFTTSDSSFQLSTSSPNKAITYSVNATDNRSISSVNVSGATFIGTSGSARTFSRTYNYADYSFGSNTQTITVTVTDVGGNTATDTITHTITKVDDQNPTVGAISTNASGNAITLTTSSTSVTVRYTVVATDNRSVNSVTWEGSDSSTLVDGNSYSYDKTYNYSDYTVNSTSSDTVSVVVADAAGNVTNKSVNLSIQTIDTQDPSIASFGSNKGGNIVYLYSTAQTNTVTFTAVVSDNVGVTSVSLPGTSAGSVSGNTHTFTKTYVYGDFNYGDTADNLTVTVSDAAGNTSTSTINMTVRKIDNISPTIAAFTADDTSVSLTTSSQTQTVSLLVTTTDNVAISTVSIPGTTDTGSSGNNYNFSKTYNYSDYSFGSHSDTLNLTVTDTAGNTSTESKTITIVKADNANPSITSFTADDTTVSLLTSSQTQTVTFTVVATDNVGISSVSIPGTTSAGSSGNNYSFTKTYNYSDFSFGSSTETLTATVSDAAGNSVTDDITINISKSDDQNPTISNFSADTTTVALLTSAQSKTVTITATITDNVGATSISLPGTTSSNSGNDYTFTKTYLYNNFSFGSATDTLTLTVADAAGNTSTESVTINISKSDDENPTVGNISASDTNVELSTSSQTQTVTFSIVASDNVGINSVTWEGSESSSSVSGTTYNFQKTYSYSDYSVGSTNSDTVSVVVADAAGNSTSKSITITIVTEDDQDPVISSLTSNKTSNIVSLLTSAQSNTATFTVTATDNVGVSSVTLTGATLSSTSGNDFIFTKAYSYADYSFGDTFDTLTATATDGVGNTTTSSIQMVIRKSDDQSPTISSFSANDSSVELKTSSQTQTVVFTVVASDNRGISTVAVPGTTVGSVSGNNYTFNKIYSYGDYSFGETTDTLTATATDAAGNTSSQSVTISITKSDDQDPTITSFSANDNTVSLTTSSQSQTVTFTAIVSDNVGVTSVGLPGTTLSSSNAGTFVFTKTYAYADYSFGSSTDTLTLTVSDAARNSVTQNINISISKQDDQNPTISSFSADDTTVSLLTSAQTQTVTFTIVASDNVGVSAVSLTGATLSSANAGTFVFTKTYDYDDYSFGNSSDTLTATVTDTANNSITDDITISINKSDDQSPSISSFTADDTTVELKTSDQSKTVTFTVVSSDNVGVSNVNIPGATATGPGTFQKTYHYNNYNFGSNTDVLTVTATDAAGNSESQQLTVTITKTDDQSPVITSVSSNKNSVALKTSDKTDSVIITAVVTDNRAVTAVTIGGNAATNTSGNNYQITKGYNYDNLSLGSSNDTMAVVASDAAGNTSTDSITIALSVVDDEDPTITSLTSDADSNAIELTTTEQTKTVTFTAVASDNIGVSSISLTGATQTNVSGSTYTFTKVYSYADYSFGANTDTLTLTVTDAAGNSSTTSITIDITKTDNQPPSISNFTANNTTVTVSTSAQTATITITALISDNVAISNVNLPGATFVANNAGNYSFTKSYSYGDYSFGNSTDTLTLTVTDTNSNSTSDTLDITISKVDDENPTITSFTVSNATVNLTTSVQSLTRDFTVVASDNVAINTVSIPGTTLSSVNGGTYVFTRTYAYNDFAFGTTLNTNTVTVTDTTGNVTTDTVDVTVIKTDNQDPVIHSFSASDTSVELKTSAQTQTVTFTTVVSDNVAINTVSLPGTTLSSSNAGTFVFSKTYDYADFGFGNTSETLTLTVTDTAGNSVTDTVSVSVSKLDDQNPSIASFSANDTSVELTTSSQSQTVTFTVAASDNVAVNTVSIPGTTASSVSGGNYLFTKTYSYGDFSFGSTSETLTATVTDTTGNSTTDTIDISISKVDNQPPSISNFVSNATNNSIELKTSDQTEIVTFTVSVADNETITSVALSTATLTSQNAGTFTFSKSYDYDDYSFGNTTDTLTLTALDNHSNSSTATIDIIVTKTDDQAPSISNFSVSDNTIELKSSSQTQSVTFSAVLSDNRAITSASIPNTVSNGNSGTTYNWSKTFNYNDYSYGDTTDTYTLTVVDAAGNTSTDSLQISVNKADDETPVISSFTANMTNVALFTSDKTQTVTFTAVASDNRAITSFSVPTATFNSNVGTTYIWTKTYSYNNYTYGTHTDTLTLTVQDEAGNTATRTVSVNITKSDDLAPTITNFGVNNSTVSLLTSAQTQTVTFSANLTDNVGITTATLPTATFSSATDGIYRWTKEYDYADYNFGSSTDNLTLTVSDAAGNTSTDSITINITKSDDQNPSITSLISNATGNAIELKSSAKTKTVVFTAVASDNVAIDTISLSNASLSSSNNGTFTFTNEFDYDDYTYGSHTSSHVLSVTDAAGNSVGETINISITKSDDEDPIISNFTVNNSSFSLFTNGTTSQLITFTLVASDNRAVNTTSIDNGASLVSVSGSTFTYTKTINYSDLASFGNNTFNFTATVTDEAGNTDTESLSVVVAKIDNENPAISSFTASSTNVALTTDSQSQTITFAAVATDNRGITSMNLPTATATDTVGPNYAWSKTYSYDDYSFGSSTDVLTVTAADDAGNTATSQVTINITKTDTQAPSINSFSASPSTLVLKTSDQLKTITFTAVANDNVGISSITIPNTNLDSVNGSTYVFTKSYDYGDYSFGNTSETHTLTVTDSTGNTTTDTVDVVIQKIDDQDPSISSFSNDTTANAIELKTSAQSKTITFTAVVTDNRAVTGVTLTGATQTSSNNGTFTFTKDYDYDDYSFGSNTDTLTLSVSDEASNISTQSVTIAITKTDDQNPTITSLNANNTTITLKTSDQSETVTFTAVVSDNVGINSIGLTGASQTGSNNGTFTFTKDYDYNDYTFGSNTDILTLTLADAAGNTATENITITINKVDDQDPVISSSSTNATNDTVTLTTSSQTQDVVFTIAAADNRAITSATHSQLSESGSQSGNNYTWTRTYSYDDFSFGSQTSANTITVADAAGNTATVNLPITVIKLDNQNPTISSVSADDSTVELKTSSQSQTVTFTVIASDNRSVSTVTLPTTTSAGVSGNNYSFTKTYNYSDYSFGNSTDTLTATATDAAGNSSTQNIVISISKTDDQNPSIASFSADDTTVDLKTSSQTQTVTFTAQVSDNVGINTVSLPGATLSGMTSILSSATYTFTKTYDYADYSFGSSSDTLTLTVTDTAGNSVTDSVTISISKTDDQAPTCVVSSNNTTANLKTSDQTKVLSFTVAVSDNVDINTVTLTGATLLYSSTAASGNSTQYTFIKSYSYANFNFGSTSETLTATATDTAGNTTTDTIDVTIVKTDDQVPSISSFTADDTSVELKTSSQTQTVTFTVSATDNVSISSVSIPGTTAGSTTGGNYLFTKTYNYSDHSFGNSSETLTATVTDSSGLTATDTITISISKVDDEDPSISSFGADDTTVELKTSSQTQTVTFTAVVSDNLGVSSVTLPGTTLSSAVAGTHVFTKLYDYDDYSFGASSDTLTLTVTDSTGNSVTDSITISITKTDDQDPTVSIGADKNSIDLKTSSQTQTVTFTVTASDNASVGSVSLPGTSFSSTSGNDRIFTKLYDYDDFSFGTSTETFTATVVDGAGNTVTDTLTITIDKIDDEVPTISSFGADDTSVELKSSSKTQTVTFTVVATDNVSVNSVALPNTTFSSLSGNTSRFIKTFDYDDYSYGDTTETYTVTVTDAANNSSSQDITINISKVDDEDPSITSFTSDKNAVSLTSTSQNDTVTFLAVFTDNRAVSGYNLPGATYQSLNDGVYRWTKNYSYDDYSFGTTTDTLTLTVQDAAGNSVTQSVSISITKSDNIAPTISNLSATLSVVDLFTSDQTKSVTITANISDNVGISTNSIQGATFNGVTNGVYSWTKTYDYVDYNFGSTSEGVELIAADAAGNQTTDSLTLVVRKFDDESPFISSFTASPNSFDLGVDNTSQVVTFSATMNDNVGITTNSLVDGNGNSLGAGSLNNGVYTWTKTYNLVDFSGNNHVENFTVSSTDAAGNSASEELSVIISTLSAIMVPGSISISTSANLTSTDENVFLIESDKERGSVLFGGNNLPDHFIKVPVNLNSFVSQGSSNLGRAVGSPDDCWGLSAISFDSDDFTSDQVTTSLPIQTGTFKVGEIAIDDSGVTSSLTSNTNLQSFNVMMTITASSDGTLVSSCQVQRADNSLSQTAEIVDSTAFATYLHFSENDNTSATNTLVASTKQPTTDWKGASLASERDSLTDNLTTVLTNSEVQTKFATEIAATNNSINGHNAIGDWAVSFNSIAADPSSALSKHARARIGRKASPDTNLIFKEGDKIFTSGSSAYNPTFRDHNNTLQTLASGSVFGVLEQTAAGAFTGTPQN